MGHQGVATELCFMEMHRLVLAGCSAGGLEIDDNPPPFALSRLIIACEFGESMVSQAVFNM